MASKQHQKHPPLSRPDLGHFARTEFALLGTTCDRIDGLLADWLPELSAEFRTLTITGDHGERVGYDTRRVVEKTMRKAPEPWNNYDDRLLGAAYDLVLVNGNHYPAARQIVFVDPKKAGTLERRKEQLTDVAAVILCPGATDMPDWLLEHLGAGPQVQGTLADSHALLTPLLRAAATANRPPLKALILTGGKSRRMGQNKSQLQYRDGLSETERLIALCRELGAEPHLSVASPEDAGGAEVPTFADRFPGLGPMGAICTAFLHEPDTAWLVLACDLPLLEAPTLRDLLAARDARKFATAVRGASKPFPEPLVAIYEPRAYARLLQFLSLGYACPRKMLINSEVAHLVIEDESPLANANTPEERAEVLKRLT